MIKLLVIADDYTGAMDTGVQFSRKGIKIMVASSSDIDIGSLPDHLQALVVNINSRHLSPEEAYKKVKYYMEQAESLEIDCIYKKTDSTLRGNIGSELAAMFSKSNTDKIMFVPAFPKNNRITKDGIHYVEGIPLEDSVFANDPFDPVKHSNISDIIREQTDCNVQIFTKDQYHRAVTDQLPQRTICVFDAETTSDLREIAGILKDAGMLHYLAGCAGFAEILPEYIGLTENGQQFRNNTGGVLIVSGSVNQITLDQIAYARTLGYDVFTLTPEQKLSAAYIGSPECDQFVDEAAQCILRSGRVIIEAVSNRDDMHPVDQYASQIGIPQNEIFDKIAGNIGLLTKEIIKKAAISTLVVFGGDTLLGIMDALECHGIIPEEEVLPGVVAASIADNLYSFKVVTKAGGFGDADVIRRISDYLNGAKCGIE